MNDRYFNFNWSRHFTFAEYRRLCKIFGKLETFAEMLKGEIFVYSLGWFEHCPDKVKTYKFVLEIFRGVNISEMTMEQAAAILSKDTEV